MTTDTPEMRKERGIPQTAVFAAYLENTLQHHNKFWICFVVFSVGRWVVITHWGRNGTKGLVKSRGSWLNKGEAIASAENLVSGKLDRGYRDPYAPAPERLGGKPPTVTQTSVIRFQCSNCKAVYHAGATHSCPPEQDGLMLGERYIDVT